MASPNLTAIAHEHWAAVLRAGDVAIDATAGNGHDTLKLLELVGSSGHVHAFDIQEQAIQATATLTGNPRNLTLHHCGHEQMMQQLPQAHQVQIALIAFNLGYLPHGDKNRTTQPQSTLAALKASAALLDKGGLLSVLAYRAHAGGLEESEVVQKFLNDLDRQYWTHESVSPSGVYKSLPPLLLLNRKLNR